MLVKRWAPLGTIQDDINRLFDTALRTGNLPSVEEGLEGREWTPEIDIYENDDNFVIEADIPGMNIKDIKIEVQDNTLTIKGEKKFEEKTEKDKYIRVERSYGSFYRSLSLPMNVDSDKIDANYKDGTLVLTLPKTEQAKPRQIKVKAH